ncbi:MAG: hypothetical protein HY765_00535 [Rhodomicrobium sp.]|nr:hypothetical protein [Rhodomicrobium sp.]
MSMAEERARARNNTHPEEWFSILLALIATVAATLYIGYFPTYEPASGGYWVVPVWLGFLYLIVQMALLLFSASQVRALGVLDSVLAIAPVVAGLVVLVQLIINREFTLSSYQLNTLAVLIVAGASEFLLTIWIRFVINRRTIGFGGEG